MTEYKNYCGKCKCEFYEKDLEYSHDFPKYLGGSDRDGRHLLCRDCHDRYENIVLREIFLKFFPERKLNIDEIIELADEKLKLNIVGKILEEQKEKNYNEIRDIIQLFSRQIDEKMKELNYPFCIGYCNKCNHGYMTKRKTKSGKEVYGCSNYPNCKHSIWIN